MKRDLQMVCDSYAKMGIAPEKKQMCVNAHGLLLLPKFIWPELNLQDFELPVNKNFNRDFALWRIANQTTQLDIYYCYPSNMEAMNEILKSPVATAMIYQPYLNSDNDYISAADKKNWYIDVDKMREQFIKRLL